MASRSRRRPVHHQPAQHLRWTSATGERTLSIESWHWIRDNQLHEDDHRYRRNCAGVMAALRTAAMNVLRLAGFDSIQEGLQAVMHGIEALLAMAWRQPETDP